MRTPMLCLLSVLALSAVLHSNIIKVPGHYDRIQDAIDAAWFGDTVLVGPGTYHENIDFLGKTITVLSEQGAVFTTIDGQGVKTVVTFQNGEGPDTVLDGFTLTGGYSQYDGGGILCQNYSSPLITHNTIVSNNSARGAGIFCTLGSSPWIKDNIITGNVAQHNGAGIFCELAGAALITGNTINANRGNEGAGICCIDSISLDITGNTITDNISYQEGGGVYIENVLSVSMSGNLIHKNSAVLKGGAVCCVDSALEITGDEMIMNSGSQGAGVFALNSTLTVEDCTLEGNTSPIGSAIAVRLSGEITVTGCTFYQNMSGGDADSNSNSALYFNDCDHVLVEDNLINDNDDGGVFCKFSELLLNNNQIYANRGSGVYFEGTEHFNMRGNIFWGNQGIGIRCLQSGLAAIEENLVCKNSARSGTAGIHCNACNVLIANNTVTENDNTAGSGGIGCVQCTGTVSDNLISWNLGTGAGGVLLYGCDNLKVTRNVITKNATFNDGGGILCTQPGSPLIENNIVIRNLADHGGGIAVIDSASPVVCNVTFYKNEATVAGGAVHVRDSVSPTEVANTILYDDVSLQGKEIEVGANGNLAIQHGNVKNGMGSVLVDPAGVVDWGPGMIDSDPLFVDAVNNDYHLTFQSPCRDAGDNAAPGLPVEDYEGNPRTAYGTADIGADEFHTHLYYTGDITPGGDIEAKFVGWQGTSPIGLFLGAAVLDPPLPTIWGSFHIQLPYILIGPLGALPADGVMVIRTTLPPLPVGPYDVPTQALIGNMFTSLAVLEVR